MGIEIVSGTREKSKLAGRTTPLRSCGVKFGASTRISLVFISPYMRFVRFATPNLPLAVVRRVPMFSEEVFIVQVPRDGTHVAIYRKSL